MKNENLISHLEFLDFDYTSGTRQKFDEYLPGVMDALWDEFPRREPGVDHPFVPWRQEIRDLLAKGARPRDLIRAAKRYAKEIDEGGEKVRKYMLGPVRFYRDGHWRKYHVVTVYGMTREEWARAGKDVLEFDRIIDERDKAGDL
jgi:hypothetical protein